MRVAPISACGLEDGLGLDMVDAFPQQDVGDLAGNALDVAVHELAFVVTESKPGCGLPRSIVKIHRDGRAPLMSCTTLAVLSMECRNGILLRKFFTSSVSSANHLMDAEKSAVLWRIQGSHSRERVQC